VNNFGKASSRRSQALRWGGTILAIALLIYLFARQGWGDILSTFRAIPVWRLVLAFMIMLLSRLAVAGRWHVLLRAVEEVPWSKSFRITFAGLFASNFLPTTIGGDVVRLAGAIQLDMDGAVSAASLVVDRLIGMFGMALAIPFGAVPLIGWFKLGRAWQTPFQFGLASSWFSQRWEKIVDLIQRMIETVKIWIRHPKALLSSLFFTALHMLCLFGSIALLLNDMGESLSLWVVGGLWSFVYFVTLLPISINGYGVQEVSMTFIFTEVGGISVESGLAISLLIRTLQMLASVPGVLFVPGIIAGAKDQPET